MDATNTGFEAGNKQASQANHTDLLRGFLARAKALAEDDLAGVDELLADIVASDLPEATFATLADAIAKSTEMQPDKVVEQLRDGREARVAGGILATGVPGLNQVPHIMGRLAAGRYLNALLGFTAHYGSEAGSPTYFTRNRDGSVTPITPGELNELLRNRLVRATDAKGKPNVIPAAKWWKEWQDRETVEVVAYDPERELERRGISVENLWRDFAIQPAKGSWHRIWQHLLAVICGGNKGCFKYLIRWLVHLVQHPGTSPEVMIVLRSTAEGVGKSTVGTIMARMLGRHALVAGSVTTVFGEFNEVLTDKSLVVLEEAAFPGDHKQAAMLKNTITARELSINPKGRPRYSIPNRLHLMLCTNERWAIPAGADARRFFVLDVKFDPPPGYFDALYAEIDNGGAAAMLHDLLQVSLAGFHPRQMPITRALTHQQRLGTDEVTQWIIDCVVAGEIKSLPGNGFNTTATSTDLYDAFRYWARGRGIQRPTSHVEFGRQLARIGLNRSAGGKRQWTIPDAATLLAAAEKQAGILGPTV
jgi:hypothetical protein